MRIRNEAKEGWLGGAQPERVPYDVTGSSVWRAPLKEFGGEAFVLGVVRHASLAIMEIYGREDFSTRGKDDGSPITEADLCAAALIEKALKERTGFPVVCEEGVLSSEPPGDLFWLVDPLDGTKEFINRNGEFTVNVALIHNARPVVGVIGVPVTGEAYVAVKGLGAHVLGAHGRRAVRNTRSGSDLIAAVSRSHAAPSLTNYLTSSGITQMIQCGSALKFCKVASGESDVYVRFGRTMEWDTAAGHCILEESGCRIINAADGSPLTYGKKGYANPSFIACRADVQLPLGKEPRFE
jgi:3'(2'), 5'-bisphosphate nucleotidase